MADAETLKSRTSCNVRPWNTDTHRVQDKSRCLPQQNVRQVTQPHTFPYACKYEYVVSVVKLSLSYL